jgi:hypothetical protein
MIPPGSPRQINFYCFINLLLPPPEGVYKIIDSIEALLFYLLTAKLNMIQTVRNTTAFL